MRFTEKEKKFLSSMEEARFATTNNKMPHVKPVAYIFEDGAFYLATDYATRSYKNIKKNPLAAITVDVYKPGGNKAVLAQGKVEIVEKGAEFAETYKKFHTKFAWVRRDPWKEGEAPFLKLVPITKVSWGL